MHEQEQELHLQATASDSGRRLDVYLAAALPAFSRSRLQALIRANCVLVDGAPAKSNLRLAGGEGIVVQVNEPAPMQAKAEEIILDIFYEDADIIVVNKPQGMVVHPAAGHVQGTLVNALLHHCGDLSGINGVIRPGIVHRIDKDTSGLLVAAKNDAAHAALAAQWKTHDIKRVYHAIVYGIVAESAGMIDAPIGRHPRDRKKMAVETKHGRNAVTHYRVLERLPLAQTTYCEMTLETGRTHQIRVHMAHIGHPVAGDAVYGPRKPRYQLAGQALHAKVLGFRHPTSGEYLEFTSELPAYFSALLAEMRQGRGK